MVENAEVVLEVTLQGATFEGGEAKVSIPFEKEIPEGKVGKVYYIANDGTKTDMNTTFVDGKVVFTTNHFSNYAVMFEDAPKSGAVIIIIAIILLLVIACAVVVVLNMKGVLKIAFITNITNKIFKKQ